MSESAPAVDKNAPTLGPNSQTITPEFKSQLQGYLHLLRGKIKALEQQIVEIQLESNQLKDDLEQSYQREMQLQEKCESGGGDTGLVDRLKAELS